MTRRLLSLCLMLIVAVPAAAEVALRWTPDDQHIEPGQGGRLSLVIDDTLHVRTIDVVVTYDPTVVASITGDAGALYTDSGVFTFKGFEQQGDGQWHGYAVLMGAGLYIQGPGELYWWDFEGLEIGLTWIETVEVSLAATDGSWYEDVTLDHTTIIVGDAAAVEPPALEAPTLRLAPNPFNPRTAISLPFRDGDAGRARLSVLDSRGRLVTHLWDGEINAAPDDILWCGKDALGQPQASGVYLFLLQRDDGLSSVVRGTLIR